MNLIRGLLLVASATLLLTVLGAAPFHNVEPNKLPRGYGEPGFEADGIPDHGDLTFVRQYPDPATLTPQEKYMVAGGMINGKKFPRWESTIYRAAGYYYKKFGKLPEVVTPEVYRAAYGMTASETSDELEVLANPLTGQWARLNQATPAPGDFYMKILSQAEKEYIVRYQPGFRSDWLEGKLADGTPINVIIPPIYYRMYGLNGVISNKLYISVQKK